MNKVIVVCFTFYFICLSDISGSTDFQKDNFSTFSLVQSELIKPELAQSQINSKQPDDFGELGGYAVPAAQNRNPLRRFGFRVFGGFNFASSIRTRYNNYQPANTFNISTEYILPHTSLMGSFSFGGSFLFLITREIGMMFSASYEIESKVEEYKYLNDVGIPRGGRCGISSRDEDYLLCPLDDQFWYSIISLELSTYYKILPSLYIFAGPNFFIPVGFKAQPTRTIGGSPFPIEIKGHLGGQAGIGFVYQKFFIEGLFKTQNFILEGIRLGNVGNTAGIFETGRLWGFMIRGGLQF